VNNQHVVLHDKLGFFTWIPLLTNGSRVLELVHQNGVADKCPRLCQLFTICMFFYRNRRTAISTKSCTTH